MLIDYPLTKLSLTNNLQRVTQHHQRNGGNSQQSQKFQLFLFIIRGIN